MSRFGSLALVLGLVATVACGDLTGLGGGGCFHSEGCGDGGGIGGGGWTPTELRITGVVTGAPTGQPLAGVAVHLQVPVRAWADTVVTDSTGDYLTKLANPIIGDCAGLSVTFIREGFEPLTVKDPQGLTCRDGSFRLDASLIPSR